jgi:hypothetical protein
MGLLTLRSIEDPFGIRCFQGLLSPEQGVDVLPSKYLENATYLGKRCIFSILTMLSMSVVLWSPDISFVASQEFVADIW